MVVWFLESDEEKKNGIKIDFLMFGCLMKNLTENYIFKKYLILILMS